MPEELTTKVTEIAQQRGRRGFDRKVPMAGSPVESWSGIYLDGKICRNTHSQYILLIFLHIFAFIFIDTFYLIERFRFHQTRPGDENDDCFLRFG